MKRFCSKVKVALLGLLGFGVMVLASCSPSPVSGGAGPGQSGYLAAFRTATPTNERQPMAHERGYWDGDAVGGAPLIRINRSEQKAYFFKGDQLVGMSPIATGKTTHTTPAGSFRITQKSKDHKSSLYGVIRDRATGAVINDSADSRKHRPGPGQFFDNTPMPYFLRFNGAVGMHEGHLPGYAASHGCVRLPREMAIKFFENVQIGTPVIVE